MEDRFEATFVLAVDAAEVWARIAEGRRNADDWFIPAFHAEAEVIAVDDGRRLHVRKTNQPCAGTEIVVTLEASESGTHVTVVQSGFGKEFFEQALDGLSVGWSHILADLVLYLERGVDGGRHLRPWAMLGCSVHETPAGLMVGTVHGGFARAAGLAPGNVLLTVGGAPVVNSRELFTVMRVFRTGDELEATWVRDSDIVRAVAPL